MGNGSRENPFLGNLKFSQPSKNQPNGKWEMGDRKKFQLIWPLSLFFLFPFPIKWPKNPDLLSQQGKLTLSWEKISQQTSSLPLECRFLPLSGTIHFPIRRMLWRVYSQRMTCTLSKISCATMCACSKKFSYTHNVIVLISYMYTHHTYILYGWIHKEKIGSWRHNLRHLDTICHPWHLQNRHLCYQKYFTTYML